MKIILSQNKVKVTEKEEIVELQWIRPFSLLNHTFQNLMFWFWQVIKDAYTEYLVGWLERVMIIILFLFFYFKKI
jgi:hypothetical protein